MYRSTPNYGKVVTFGIFICITATLIGQNVFVGVLIAVLMSYFLLMTIKEINLTETDFVVVHKFNPFKNNEHFKYERFDTLLYVNRTSHIRATSQTSFIELIKTQTTIKRFYITLSDSDMRKLREALNKMNIGFDFKEKSEIQDNYRKIPE